MSATQNLPTYRQQRQRLAGVYQELYLRWLQARRDYPQLDVGPAPAGHGIFAPWDIETIRRECEREFYRAV